MNITEAKATISLQLAQASINTLIENLAKVINENAELQAKLKELQPKPEIAQVEPAA